VTTTEERSDGISEELEDIATSVALLFAERIAAGGMVVRQAARDAVVFAGVPDVLADRDRARSVAVALEQQVEAVERLHQPVDDPDDGLIDGKPSCSNCENSPWPCRTIRFLSPAGDEDGDRG
jgi:hypothetical protein